MNDMQNEVSVGKTSRMIFVFSGEKKIVALLLLVVAFGATFGASLTKNQLEVCHLLEGTQDDLATHNDSSVKVENSKVEWRAFGLQDMKDFSSIAGRFRSIKYSEVEMLNATVHQIPIIFEDFGGVCARTIWFTMVSMRDFQKNWDDVFARYDARSGDFSFFMRGEWVLVVDSDESLHIKCVNGDCSADLLFLTRGEWVFELDLGESSRAKDKIYTTASWDFPLNQTNENDIAILSSAFIFDEWRRKLFGGLNFGTYHIIVNFSLFLFFGFISILGYTYVFEREYPSTTHEFFDLNVQGREDTQELVWQRILQRVIPGREIVFSKRRVNKNYRVTAVVTMRSGKIKYVCDSKESYHHAYLHLALRWPKKESDFALQGVFGLCGIRETPALKFLKCTFFFVYAFWRSRNLTDKIICTTHWIDQLHDIGLTKGIDVRLMDFYTLFKNLPVIKNGKMSSDYDKSSGNKMNVHIDFDSSDDEKEITTDFGSGCDVQGIEDFASLLNSFLKGVFNSSSIKACFRLISLLWHLLFIFKDGKVDWDHLNRWDTAMFSSIPEKALNIGNTLLEQISNLATCSWEFYQTGDVNVFLRNDNEVSSFLESVEKLSAEVKNVPIEPKLNASMTDLEARIHNLILKGENMRPKVKASIRASFTTGLLQLRSLALDVMTLARASSTRAAPFTLLITGAPKIGKSSITSTIFKQFQLTNPYNTVLKNGLKLHDNGVYTRTLKEEYWSCYMNSYWGILYDDLGQTNPKCPEFALEINEIIQVVNNVMFFPQMAGVDEKGRRYVAPQIVIATSNNRDLNSHHAVRSPGAVLRRFPFVVTPKLRPQYATDSALDAKKAGDNMDLWTFKIEEIVLLNNGQNYNYRVVHEDLSTSNFLRWVSDASLEHYKGQANGDEFQKKINSSRVCSKCSILSAFCMCKSEDDCSIVSEVKDIPALVESDDESDCEIKPVEPSPTSARFSEKQVSDEIVEEDAEDESCRLLRNKKKNKPRVKSKNIKFGDNCKPQYQNHFGENCNPQFKSQMSAYTSYTLFLFSVVQLGIMGIFLSKIASEPTKWFWRMYTQKAATDTFGHSFAVGFAHGRNTYAALFWRFMNNFYKFDAVDSALLMWLNGWNCVSSWAQQSVIKIKNSLVKNPKMVAAIASVLVSGMFLVWYAQTTGAWSCDVQGNGEISPGVEPPPAAANIENTWKSSQKLGFTAFLTPQSRSGDVAWFEGQMLTTTARLKFNKAEGEITAFNVFSNYWLLPKHYTRLPNFLASTHVTVTRYCHTAGMGAYYGVFDQSSLIEDPNSDFSLIRLNTPPGVNLIPYLTKAPSGTMLRATVLFLREEGVISKTADPVKFGDSSFPEVSIMNGMGTDHKYRAGYYDHPFVSVNGDCGSPIFVNEYGKIAILGFHVGNQNSQPTRKFVMAAPVDFIKSVYEKDQFCVVQGGLDTEKLDGKKIELEDDVHPKCPIRFPGLADMPSGNSAIPIGSFKGLPMNHFATKVRENLFAPFWKAQGYVSNKVRPVLSSVGIGSWMPKRNFLLNACQHKDLIPHHILDACADHFLSAFCSKVKESSIKDCVVINEETNLYGANNNNFISHMKFDTGAGFPHNKPKHMVLDRVEHPKFPDGTCAIPSTMRMKIERMEKTASEGVRINLVFNSSLKDEPISQKKLEAGKIRVFQAISVEGLFLLRKYYLSLIALFQTWNFASEAAIGMDTTGPDWDDLHDYIFVDDWKVFCGDYSNYDQRMGSSIMMKAWGIMIALAQRSGNYSTISLKIMWVLGIECCYSMVNFFGDLLCLNGSNPSGHGLTVVINSICNSIYIRVAWYDIFGNLDDFSAHVRMMTYGDDNIISVHPIYQERFNQVTVTAALAKYGIVYTDAMKTGNEAKPFCEPHEISFLKRSWVRSPHGFWCAPLEIASIHKMLIIGVDSGKAEEKDRLASILLASVMEAFHHGEEFFETHRALVVKCADEYELNGWMKGGIPTFQELLEKRGAKVSRLALLRAAH